MVPRRSFKCFHWNFSICVWNVIESRKIQTRKYNRDYQLTPFELLWSLHSVMQFVFIELRHVRLPARFALYRLSQLKYLCKENVVLTESRTKRTSMIGLQLSLSVLIFFKQLSRESQSAGYNQESAPLVFTFCNRVQMTVIFHRWQTHQQQMTRKEAKNQIRTQDGIRSTESEGEKASGEM